MEPTALGPVPPSPGGMGVCDLCPKRTPSPEEGQWPGSLTELWWWRQEHELAITGGHVGLALSRGKLRLREAKEALRALS